jgi:hypothetical protein
MVPYGTWHSSICFSALEACCHRFSKFLSTCIGIIRKVATGHVVLPIRRIPSHAQVLWTLPEEGQMTQSK